MTYENVMLYPEGDQETYLEAMQVINDAVDNDTVDVQVHSIHMSAGDGGSTVLYVLEWTEE
jgi:hypothetical protein